MGKKFDELQRLLTENANLNPPGVKVEPYTLDYCMGMLRHELLGIALDSNNAEGAEVFLRNGGVILPYTEDGLHVIEKAAQKGYWQVVECVAKHTIGIKKEKYDFHEIAKPDYTKLVCMAIDAKQFLTAKYLDSLLSARGDLIYDQAVAKARFKENETIKSLDSQIEAKNNYASLTSPSHCQSSTFAPSPKASDARIDNEVEELTKKITGNFGLT